MALAIALAGQACVWSAPLATTPSGDPPLYAIGWTQTGIASWYGEPFHGRNTAAGSTYDMDGISAAHQTIPFGTRIRVDNLDNGRSIELPVTDRGPLVRGRILDVSRAAARALGMIGPGTAQVRIIVVGPPNAVSALGGCVVIQVAAFRERRSAEAKREEVARAGFEASIEPYEDVYRVVAGPFVEEPAADRARETLGGFMRPC
ncbi:septal ring lytic transglycosylase RlpA family protein [Candidatus Palauibacter sp.]|uniref:septal ring lytic transglycosylase RlpA family protein n=1 Tax=Candidatus Palauibacter sp. TaxID=3101350 RepID=UPI003B5289AE